MDAATYEGGELFSDRADAGRRLAEMLADYAGGDMIVLGLPRGGVPVAYEVARSLGAPLDIFVVRKLGVPGRSELAMGAIASGGVRVVNERVLRELGLPDSTLASVAANEQHELERQEQSLRGEISAEQLRGRRVIVVDDGLATGASMRAAVLALHAQGVAEIVVAVPVAAPSTCESLGEEVDAVVCAITPHPFSSVGQWYEDFEQVSDDEVRDLLERAALKGD